MPALQAWLRRHRWKQRLKNGLLRRRKDPCSHHPWRYLAEIRCGSDPAAIQHQLNHWTLHGFNDDELRHVAALPATAPEAQSGDPPEPLQPPVALQRGQACAAELLRLASINQVWDRDRHRVGMLRQFGIKAYWQRQ